MKKIISFLILIIFIGMLLCGCYHKTYTDDNKTIYYHHFILIHEDVDPIAGDTRLAYDKNTKIVYLFVNRDMLSPYYIIVDGEPTIAIYGVNYEYQE
jgi:hypothetical protein